MINNEISFELLSLFRKGRKISVIFIHGVYYLEKPGKPGILREFYLTGKNLEYSGNILSTQGNFTLIKKILDCMNKTW